MKLSETDHPTKPDIPSCMRAGALCAVTHSNGLLTPWSTTFSDAFHEPTDKIMIRIPNAQSVTAGTQTTSNPIG